MERLDPFSLPLRFVDADPLADDHMRHVEIDRERVIVQRTLRGIKMAVTLPLTAYRGVALRMEPPTPSSPAAVAVVLEHLDPALSLTVCRTRDGSEITAEWRCWGDALDLPLLVAQADGSLREPFARVGRVGVAAPVARRRRRSSMRRRPASMPLRRGPATLSPMTRIHAGEREIIARN